MSFGVRLDAEMAAGGENHGLMAAGDYVLDGGESSRSRSSSAEPRTKPMQLDDLPYRHGEESIVPPSPRPSALAPRPKFRAGSNSRGLSLSIPEDGRAFGGLFVPPKDGLAYLDSPDEEQGIIQYALDSRADAASLQSRTATINSASAIMDSKSFKARQGRKKPSRLNLAPPLTLDEAGASSRSVPNSPSVATRPVVGALLRKGKGRTESSILVPTSEAKDLSNTLRGTPRRRPSMPFGNKGVHGVGLDRDSDKGISSGMQRPPEAFRDPSEHILSGKGSTLQHARSVYSRGPVEILPGLFLGDEHNARDNEMLSGLGITTVLNVAKETTLPFQSEQGTSPMISKPSMPSISSRGRTQPNSQHQEPKGPTSDVEVKSGSEETLPALSPTTANKDTFYTPPTTALPSQSILRSPDESDPGSNQRVTIDQISPVSSLSPDTPSITPTFLRNTLSTPNLQSQYQKYSGESPVFAPSIDAVAMRKTVSRDGGSYRLPLTSSSSEDAGEDSSSRASQSSYATTASPSAAEPASLFPPDKEYSFHTDQAYSTRVRSESEKHRWAITTVELPKNATALNIPASPMSNRLSDLRYIKLPWTHDETDLASSDGGFTHGCAIIAEALGIDARLRYPSRLSKDAIVSALGAGADPYGSSGISGEKKGSILVHCQCGVSRSATLVIAFVMQAAALRYGYEESKSLMGMHDCYNMVKEKSASISPNISLIYQLVEWERHLSAAASKLREALGESHEGQQRASAGGSPELGPEVAGWSSEVMDEEMWTKMRMDEERKEAEEEDKRKKERLAEAVRAAAERKAAAERLEGAMPSPDSGHPTVSGQDAGGLSQRRKKKTPALLLKGSAGELQTRLPLARKTPPKLTIGVPKDSGSIIQAIETPHRTTFDKDASFDKELPPLPAEAFEQRGDPHPGPNPDRPSLNTSLAMTETTSPSPTLDPSLPSLPSSETIRARPSTGSEGPPSSFTFGLSSKMGSGRSRPMSTSNATSSPMSVSLSVSSGMARFSYAGPPTASLSGHSSSHGHGVSSSGSSNTLFGAALQSREERRKQHRRTFSSDWPALKANLEMERLNKLELQKKIKETIDG
ncbi:phosphatases II [Violaceomyces palustris]|uniref:Phosphatases II n=1 Tax=Violaceomyces palustris TaxID=1673888 RepID=A0ACD0P0L5_9BASI|nr:phosphatases II [Violaceomyces palustris]